jgi:altronate dehydratase
MMGRDSDAGSRVLRERPRAIVLDPADNVAVALRALSEGEEVVVGGTRIRAATAIPMGHKLARLPIGDGEAVLKYHETIGIASAPIGTGEHVHVHNVRSARLPGR